VLSPIFGIGHEMKISGECRRRETVPAIDGGIDVPPIFGIAIKPHSSGAARGFVSASLLRRVIQKVVAFPTN
jgi:hypothetical protein